MQSTFKHIIATRQTMLTRKLLLWLFLLEELHRLFVFLRRSASFESP
jgi:hypothetical protein